MRFFLDVNVIMEFFANRDYRKEAKIILKGAEQGMYTGFISAMTFDTLTYLLGNELKKEGVHEPQKRAKIRNILNYLLKFLIVVDISQPFLSKGLNDESFKDLEDACQYYCAVENNCDGIITLNVKDFVGKHEEDMPVYSIIGFATKFIE